MSGPVEAICSLAVPPEDIFYISWTFDANDGVGMIRTDDAPRGEISLLTSEDQMPRAMEVIEALRREGIAIELRGTQRK